jgi:Protein of unknown function (DUF3096)
MLQGSFAGETILTAASLVNSTFISILYPQPHHPSFKELPMNNLQLQPIIAILAGILILLRPALLNYVVALYLIIIGILGLMGSRRL